MQLTNGRFFGCVQGHVLSLIPTGVPVSAALAKLGAGAVAAIASTMASCCSAHGSGVLHACIPRYDARSPALLSL